MTSDPSGSVPAHPSPLTYLHIATSEASSSYVQDVLAHNSALLAADGMHLRSIEPRSATDPATIEAIVSSIGQLEVVLTTRDLIRAVPSAWLDTVKHGSTETFEAFVDALIGDPRAPTSERFWAQHDVAVIVEHWAHVVGPERVHLVTAPPSGSSSTLLWERFCSVLGTDPSRYDASPRQATPSSLSSGDTELLRRINAELDGALSTEAYDRYVRTFLAEKVMQPEPPVLDPVGRAWASRAAAGLVDALSRSGIDIVGDLADLVPRADDGDGDGDAATDEPPPVHYPETTVRVMSALLQRITQVDPELGPSTTGMAAIGLDEPAESELTDGPPDRVPGRRRAAARRDAAERENRTGAKPVRRTFLHIGTYKTGTSFIQSVLLRNRELLADHDVCFPTDQTNWRLQTHGVRDLLAQPDVERDGVGRLCRRLVDTILMSGRSTAVVSVERLSTASTAQARALVRSLQPSEVHVIMTLRDLARVLPSDWQSKIKQGATWSFEEYAAAAMQPQGSGGRANRVFWGHHDAVDIAERWLAAVGRDRFHVVTVPPPGAPAALLWERFCSVLGIDPSPYDISQDAKSNFSLTYSDTEFLRQVNRSVGQSIDADARKHWVTRYLANEVLRPTAGDPARADRPRLDRDTEHWIEAHAAKVVAALRGLDLDVVGDLVELVPRGGATDPRPSQPAVDHPERGAEIVAALLRKLAEVDGTFRMTRRQHRGAARGREATGSARRVGGRRRPG